MAAFPMPSFGDVVVAIKIICHIANAFGHAKGAKKQYIMSCGFLRQLVPILRRIHAQANDETQDEDLRAEQGLHAQAIGDAYGAFDDYLSKKYSGLSAKEPGKAKKLLATVKWGLDELHEKVQKLKARIAVTMEPYQTLMLQEVYEKVIDIREDCQNMSANTEDNSRRYEDMSAVLRHIDEQVMVGQDGMLEAQARYSEEQKEARLADTKSICGRLDEIQEQQGQQVTKADLEAMNAEQRTAFKAESAAAKIGQMEAARLDLAARDAELTRLAASRDEIVALVQRQHEQSRTAEEAARWERLQARAERQAEKQAAEQKQAREQVQQDMKSIASVATGIGELTDDQRLKVGAKKLGALEGIVSGLLDAGS